MCIVYCTIRYDDDIFIVRAKAETASLILPHCDITKKIMGETRDKKKVSEVPEAVGKPWSQS